MTQAIVVVNGTRYPVPQQGLRIGRAPENDIVLADPNISRQHLVIWSTPRGAFLRDLGSQNGTYIAGRRVGAGPEAIPVGSQVRIGVTDLQVEVIQGAGVQVGGGGYAAPQNGGYDVPGPQPAPQPGPAYGNGGGPQYGAAAPPYGGGNPAPGPYAAPQPAPPPRRSSATGWVIGGVLFVLIIAMIGTGTLVMRAVADNRATPTPTSRPVAVSATTTPIPTVAAKPTTAPVTAKPTEPPAKPTLPPATQAQAAPPKPTAPAEPKPAGGGESAFARALKASVRVVVPTGPGLASTGSGSILTAKGHILTNYHVVSDDNGVLVNQGNNIRIQVPQSQDEQATDKYRAKVMDFDQKLDLAILQIQAMIDGSPLPGNLGLTPIPIGNSKSVSIGDSIVIIGFPGLGGASLTVTRGIHSGIARFNDDPGSFIKTDTEINRGNSGGTAINAAGELIGIPTAGRIDREATGKIGLVRPIDEAKPLIDKSAR